MDKTISVENIPTELRKLNQWVVWKVASRSGGDKPTKLPFQLNGQLASASDPATWCAFDDAVSKYSEGGFEGIGFEFTREDEFCGIDLDGCRNPATGMVSGWAREIILAMNTYAEVSPSQTGVKLYVAGKSPFASGKKLELKEQPRIVDKTPAIELYDWGRYFAVTGLRLQGMPHEPQDRQQQLDELCKKWWPVEPVSTTQIDFQSESAVVERARKYIARMPPAISGQGGHHECFKVACVLVLGFELDESTATHLLREYNQTCQPPWSERELAHKIRSAAKQGGQRGYLRNASPKRWDAISVPNYESPTVATKNQPKITTVADATRSYISQLKTGKSSLIDLGISDVDYAIGGGVERGELVIMAARPSHGKSLVAMQCVHQWANAGIGSLIVSEEMSALALGKRTLQFISDVPQEHWETNIDVLEQELNHYEKTSSMCYIAESCGTVEAAVEQIERAVEEHGITAAVVDYAQLLRGSGKSRYEQITNVSVALKQAAGRCKIVLIMLCQLSREIEKRNKFMPCMSDIKETGQLEQDADVILFLVWPHRIDRTQPAELFQVYVAKNRNRAINAPFVECRINPARQAIMLPKPTSAQDHPSYHDEFA
jgi:KaiC/GvpD/RAD55 family RecA-like ATPase